MTFIRTRKLKYDTDNKIISGIAAIIESHYIPGNTVYIDTPNRQVKEYYKGYGITIPKELDVSNYTDIVSLLLSS